MFCFGEDWMNGWMLKWSFDVICHIGTCRLRKRWIQLKKELIWANNSVACINIFSPTNKWCKKWDFLDGAQVLLSKKGHLGVHNAKNNTSSFKLWFPNNLPYPIYSHLEIGIMWSLYQILRTSQHIDGTDSIFYGSSHFKITQFFSGLQHFLNNFRMGRFKSWPWAKWRSDEGSTGPWWRLESCRRGRCWRCHGWSVLGEVIARTDWLEVPTKNKSYVRSVFGSWNFHWFGEDGRVWWCFSSSVDGWGGFGLKLLFFVSWTYLIVEFQVLLVNKIGIFG